MATFQWYRKADGARRITATVRVAGFKPASKAFDTKRDASEWASTLERELADQRGRGGAREDVGELTVRTLVERFLRDPGVRQLQYQGDLTRLLAEWVNAYGDFKVRAFGRFQISAFRDKLAARLAPATCNRYLSAMRRCWNWGIEQGYVLGSAPWPKKLMLKEPTAREVLASVDELGVVFAECDKADPALGNLVRFLVGTGARLSDALAVTWRDVDLKAGDVALRGQKTGKPLRVAMLSPAVDAVHRAGKVRHVGGRVFWQFKNRMAPRVPWWRARPNFPERLRAIRLHDARHLCASLLAASGATDVELAAQLGHSTLQMVKRYAHIKGGHRGEGHRRVDELFVKRRPASK